MPAISIRVLDDAPPRIIGQAEALAFSLKPPNDPEMIAYLGRETRLPPAQPGRPGAQPSGLLVLRGECFRYPSGWVQSHRYLLLAKPGNDIQAALIVMHIARHEHLDSVISNIYVRPDHRRQGLARALIQSALADHPKLCVDSSMSLQGAALFGYASTALNLPPSAPRVLPNRKPTRHHR